MSDYSKSTDTNITAVILAGGLGTRLRSVIPGKPKVIAEVNNQPFIIYLLKQLDNLGLDKVVICTGYMSEVVKKEIGSNYNKMHIIYSEEKKPLGTGGALRLAMPLIKTQSILVMNGDSYLDINLNNFIEWATHKKTNAALCLVKMKDTKRFGRVVLNDDFRIKSFEEKNKNDVPGYINAGIYILDKELLITVPVGEFCSIESDLFQNWLHKNCYGYICDNIFFDIGTPESYREANDYFSK
jgi:D-glycero-alpha-D-manno-heptose 1-phosphate guanylyltransferase